MVPKISLQFLAQYSPHLSASEENLHLRRHSSAIELTKPYLCDTIEHLMSQHIHKMPYNTSTGHPRSGDCRRRLNATDAKDADNEEESRPKRRRTIRMSKALTLQRKEATPSTVERKNRKGRAAPRRSLSRTKGAVVEQLEWKFQQHLCTVCRSIDFKALLFQFPKSLGENDDSSSDKAVDLGFLDELTRRSRSCQFCALVLDGATRINEGKEPPTTDESKGERVKCFLRKYYFCSLYDTLHEGKHRKEVDVNRLVVYLDPYPDSGKYSKWMQWWGIQFQPYMEPAPSVEGLYDLTGFGRVMKPLVDVQGLRNWLRQCEDLHGKACHAQEWLGNIEQPNFLRVIDVERRCIVRAPPSCRYLALSYVWGSEKSAQTTKANIRNFRNKNGLGKDILPETIADSVKLVIALGERYLWVDRLCITQDDESDMAEQVPKMDLIYAGALLTIIVAIGEDATSGLPGLREGSRSVRQRTVRVAEDLFLMQTVLQGRAGHLQYSTWNSRGWTFQERLLSRRALIFTPNQVYWKCETSTWNEETILEPLMPKFWLLPFALECNDEWESIEPKFGPQTFNTYISQYSSRGLTNHSDALSAFSGILSRMQYRNGEIYHWGLAYTRFDQELLWKYGEKRREKLCRITSGDGLIRYVPFPSWSWLGWIGFIGADFFNDRLHQRTLRGDSQSELDFYKLGVDGRVEKIERAQPISNTRWLRSRKSANDPFEELRKQWRGTTKVQGPVTIRSKSRSLSRRLIYRSQLTPERNNIPSDKPTTNGLFHDTGRLVFWTSHAKIFAQRAHSWDKIYVEIAGNNVELEMSGREITGIFNRKTREKKRLLDFIVVSRYCAIGQEFESAVLNLLVIRWSEEELDVARRIGNARMDESDWVRVDRDWKLVILE